MDHPLHTPFDIDLDLLGITINSHGVSLVYPDWQFDGDEQEEEVLDPRRCPSVYVGNIPFASVTSIVELEAEIRDVFSKFGAVASIEVNAKRGFAVVHYEEVAASDRAIAAKTSVGGRMVWVQRQGEGSVQALALECTNKRMPLPVYTTLDDGRVQVCYLASLVAFVLLNSCYRLMLLRRVCHWCLGKRVPSRPTSTRWQLSHC